MELEEIKGMSAPEALDDRELTPTHIAPHAHPVKAFLADCGLDVSHFPNVKVLIEVTERDILANRVCIPLRLPKQPGVLYETFLRVTRVLEIPGAQAKGHRKFLELEWSIFEEPLLEEENHAALSFLAGELECAACREYFIPVPEIVDKNSLRVSCPQCLRHWVFRVETAARVLQNVELILDTYHTDPSRFRQYLNEWEMQALPANDSIYHSFFPFSFENWDSGTALDWLFGEVRGFNSVPNGQLKDFETLARGLVNFFALEYFRKSGVSGAHTSRLDQTEITRKTEIQKKEEAQRRGFAQAMPTTSVKDMSWALPPKELEHAKERSWMKPAAFAAMALITVSVLSYFIFFSQSLKESTSEVADTKAPVIPAVAPIATPTPTAPEPAPQAAQTEIAKAKEAVKPTLKKVENVVKEIKVADLPAAPNPQEVKEIERAQITKAEEIEQAYRKAMLHLKLQQSDDAIASFKKVIDLDDHYSSAYRGLGLAYVYSQDFQNAIGSFEKYLQLFPKAGDRQSIEELLTTLRERAGNSVAKQ